MLYLDALVVMSAVRRDDIFHDARTQVPVATTSAEELARHDERVRGVMRTSAPRGLLDHTSASKAFMALALRQLD